MISERLSTTYSLLLQDKTKMVMYHDHELRKRLDMTIVSEGIETEEELEDIGFYEYTEDPEGIVVIEWSDKFPQCMPEERVVVRIEKSDDGDGRHITFASVGERYQEFIKELESFVYLSH